jgi:3-oxoacyl-[acyl-carrier-protein] synthase III
MAIAVETVLTGPSVEEVRLPIGPGRATSFEEVEADWLGWQDTRSRVAGTGSYVPEITRRNGELASRIGESDTWIRSRTGISERRIAPPEQAASDLALEASRRALASAGVSADQLDLIVVATVTPDTPMPSTACRLQALLKCRGAAAFDVSAACSGFLYALAVADNFVRAGSAQCALVVGVDLFSRIVNDEDRSTCLLFGDGAGAVVLQATHGDSRILSTHLFADGAEAGALEIPAGGSRMPPSHASVDRKLHTIVMPDGQQIFRAAVQGMSEAARTALEANGLTSRDLTLIIPHQANLRIIEALGERLGLAKDRIYTNIDRYGNTSAASIPLALDEAARASRLKAGDLLMLTAFGSGFTWGSALVRWG